MPATGDRNGACRAIGDAIIDLLVPDDWSAPPGQAAQMAVEFKGLMDRLWDIAYEAGAESMIDQVSPASQ